LNFSKIHHELLTTKDPKIINPKVPANPDERPSNGLSEAMMKISQAPEFASFGRRAPNGRSDIFIPTRMKALQTGFQEEK
jgi:hypothetical protein